MPFLKFDLKLHSRLGALKDWSYSARPWIALSLPDISGWLFCIASRQLTSGLEVTRSRMRIISSGEAILLRLGLLSFPFGAQPVSDHYLPLGSCLYMHIPCDLLLPFGLDSSGTEVLSGSA